MKKKKGWKVGKKKKRKTHKMRNVQKKIEKKIAMQSNEVRWEKKNTKKMMVNEI